MSIDRRILSILYANGIHNVNDVQEFLGEKNNYYEIKINNEVKKLKIPGYTYFDVNNEIENVIEAIEKEPILSVETFTFEEELEKSDKENEKLLEEIKNIEVKVEEPKVDKPKKETKPRSNTKKSKQDKKIDNDLDDFINLV